MSSNLLFHHEHHRQYTECHNTKTVKLKAVETIP